MRGRDGPRATRLAEARPDAPSRCVTGGKGFHVIAPADRRAEWPECQGLRKAFAEKIADRRARPLRRQHVEGQAQGRIFVDYLRNERGSTAIAPYSTRARDGAPVATPVTWDELPGLKAANVFSLPDALKRLEDADPWSDYFGTRQSLSAAKLKKIGLEGVLD